MICSVFSELCQCYSNKISTDESYVTSCIRFAIDFSTCVKAAIAAPDVTFETVDQYGKTHIREFVELKPVDGNWNIVDGSIKNPQNIFIDQRGYLNFKVCITLIDNESALKKTYEIPCGVRPISSDKCYLFIFKSTDSAWHKHGEWRWSIPEANTKEFVEHIMIIIRDVLITPPYLDVAPLPITS